MYSKTYIGIIVIIAGWLGVADIVSDSVVAQLVDAVIVLVGMVQTIYGRYKAGGISVLGFKK